jgi:hypothetical protein
MRGKMLFLIFISTWHTLSGQITDPSTRGFTIDLDSTSFKFAGNQMLTLDGLIPTKSPIKATMAFWKWPIEIPEAEWQTNAELKVTGMMVISDQEGEHNISSTPIEIDGLKGYEAIGQIDDSGETTYLAYSTVLHFKGGYIWIQASCYGDFKNNLKQFKQIARSYKRTGSN